MSALSFLLGTVADLYMLCFVIRLALYWHGADPRNPVASAVLRLTNPVAAPLRLLVKPSPKVETHVLLALVLLECLLVWFTVEAGCLARPSILQIALYGLVRALRLALWFYLLAVIAWALLSWFGPGGYNPVVGLLHRICTPAMAPIRKVLPNLGGVDFSPLVFILAVRFLISLLPGMEVARQLNCAAGFSPI